jgi:hypothetical protein
MHYSSFTRRDFVKQALAGVAALCFCPPLVRAGEEQNFSFPLLGDLHFDKLDHHDLPVLGREKPDDLRQVGDYSRITAEIMPKLFAAVREKIKDLNGAPETKVPFLIQVGDLVEGLCGTEDRAIRQNSEAVEFVRGAQLGVPFLFTKGNHDITGAGAPAAFKAVLQPFLAEQAAAVQASAEPTGARYAIKHGDALFCFFDAYDKESLAWLETILAARTAHHCFVIVHPPAVPYGARATWHIFSSDRERPQRERFLELLGKNNAIVLGGHIHKYNLLTRNTPRGGRFVQFAVSSVISGTEVQPQHVLMGASAYNPDQVSVEPQFSPGNEQQRRAVYDGERPFVNKFEYADLPGYAVITVNGTAVSAKIYSGVSRTVWREIELAHA